MRRPSSINFSIVPGFSLIVLLMAACSPENHSSPNGLASTPDERFPNITVINVFEPPGESNVRSSFQISDGTGLIGTEESADIFKTDDNGLSWRKVFDGGDAWDIADVRNYIRGQDGSIYITSTDPATVGRSTDDGESWENIFKAPASRTVGIVQLDSGVILVGLRRSENMMTSIIRTEDYFQSFEWIPLSKTAVRQNTTCFGYWGGDVVLAGVGYEGSGKIYKSMDGGLSWSKQSEIEGARDVMNFFKAGNDIYVLTSGIGTLFKSSDNGDTWSLHHQFWAKGFLGECEPFTWQGKDYLLMAATDQSQEIYRHLVLISDDQGATWHEWTDLANEAMGKVYSSKDSGGGASNLSVLSEDTIVVGVGNHSVQGRVYTLRVGD